MFKTITFKGFTALVTARVADGWDPGTIYLELTGADAAVRAMWARLVSAQTKKTGYAKGIEVDGHEVKIEKHTKYLTLKQALSNGQMCLGLLHPGATVLEPGDGSFYIVAEKDHEEPPARFFPMLAKSLSVPIKVGWAGWLWERALGQGSEEVSAYYHLVCKLDSSGNAVGYRVATHDQARWLKLIRTELGFKLCESCGGVAEELLEVQQRVGYRNPPQYKDVVVCRGCFDAAPGIYRKGW